MVVADCLGKPPRGCRQCRRREPHLQGPGKLRVHQFTPAREAFTRQEIPCCREEWDEDLVIVSSVVSTPSIWEERLSTVAYDLLRNSGSQGDRLTRPRSLYCHSLGKAGRRACVSCHQMLVIMTNDEMCYFHQSHGRQKGHRELGCRRLQWLWKLFPLLISRDAEAGRPWLCAYILCANLLCLPEMPAAKPLCAVLRF